MSLRGDTLVFFSPEVFGRGLVKPAAAERIALERDQVTSVNVVASHLDQSIAFAIVFVPAFLLIGLLAYWGVMAL